MTEAESARQSLLLGVTRLIVNSKHVVINHKQFLQSLADNLKRRLMTVTTDGSGTHVASGSTQQQSHSKKLIDQLSVLNPDNWPAEMEFDYGEEQIHLLCRRFRLHYSTARDAYSDFKDSGGRKMPLGLNLLMNAVNTIPVSTAECERGFSVMNVIFGERRAKLLVQHVSDLMFIKHHGPGGGNHRDTLSHGC
jgi:hAT family C-terminal dimerisation region